MKTEVICLGKLKEQYLKDTVNEYEKRLGRYTKLTIKELTDEKTTANPNQSEIEIVKAKEGERVLSKLLHLKGYTVFPLAQDGKALTSRGFANLIDENPRCVFIIGGSHGLSSAVLSVGNPISFSPMTFPHQMMRVILLEQIYRSYKILNNEPYHK